jgi:hypothetical protein
MYKPLVEVDQKPYCFVDLGVGSLNFFGRVIIIFFLCHVFAAEQVPEIITVVVEL